MITARTECKRKNTRRGMQLVIKIPEWTLPMQEIQRELEELEVGQQDVEQRGVELEQQLAKWKEGQEPSELLQQWYALLAEKNALVRKEQELMVGSKTLELEDLAERLEMELAQCKGAEGEGAVLDQLVTIAEQRELLATMLARDQERYKKEDLQMEQKMAQQGIR